MVLNRFLSSDLAYCPLLSFDADTDADTDADPDTDWLYSP
jgi:hypothetical protein